MRYTAECEELNRQFEEIKKERFDKLKKRAKFVAMVIIAVALLLITFKTSCGLMTDNVTINSTQLPHNRLFNLNVTLGVNNTLYIERVDTESRLDISYPEFKTFADDSEMISFNVSITENITDNATIVSLFNLTNSVNNNSYIYSIVYNYIYVPADETEENTTIIEDKEFFVTIIDGNYLINITTNLLPKEGKLHYDIGGLAGETLTISCPKGWLDCPDDAVFNSNNRTKFDIKYRVPLSAKKANNTYTINLTSGNITRKTKVTFQITEPDITFMNYVFPEDCFVSLDNSDLLAVKYDCVLESQKSIIDNAILYLKNKRNSLNESFCGEICPVKTETEYVMVGNISKSVRDDYDICRNDRDNYKFSLNKCLDTKGRLITNISDLKNALANNETECLSSVFDTSVQLKTEAEEFKAKTNKDFWFWMVGVHFTEILIVFIFIWYKKHSKEAWQSW